MVRVIQVVVGAAAREAAETVVAAAVAVAVEGGMAMAVVATR